MTQRVVLPPPSERQLCGGERAAQARDGEDADPRWSLAQVQRKHFRQESDRSLRGRYEDRGDDHMAFGVPRTA